MLKIEIKIKMLNKKYIKYLILFIFLNILLIIKFTNTQNNLTEHKQEKIPNLEENFIFDKSSRFESFFLDEKSKKIIDDDIEKNERIGITEVKRSPKIIASLTSFPPRIHCAKYSIYSILNQSFKPDEVILWLSRDEFLKSNTQLLKELLKLQKWGLTIRWVDENIMSHKKYFYALQEYPEDLIVLFDDDLFYRQNIIKNLYNCYDFKKNFIVCNIAQTMMIDSKTQKLVDTYDLGKDFLKPTYNKKFWSGYGSIIKKDMFDKEVLRKDKFMKLFSTCDESWLWIMAVKNKTKTLAISSSPKQNKNIVHLVDQDRDNKLPALFKTNDCRLLNSNRKKLLEEYGILSYLLLY